MTVFGEDKMRTTGEVMKSALECNTPEEARVWLEREIAIHVECYDKEPAEAERTIRKNLAFGASYFHGEEEVAKVIRD